MSDLKFSEEGYSKMAFSFSEQANVAKRRAEACANLRSAIYEYELVMNTKVDISIKPRVSKAVVLAEKLAKAEDRREELI